MKKNMQKLSTPLAISMVALLLSACGGSGGSSGPDTNPPETDATADSGNPDSNGGNNLLTGRIVDSAVSGIQFDTASQSGRTNANGEFSYQAGESVVFSIGDIDLPSIPADTLITPLDIFSAGSNIADPSVINLTRLLQTLDTDGNADNGITIDDAAHLSATGLDVDFTASDFDLQVGNLIANSGSVTTQLIDGETALDHFEDTLMAEGLVDAPPETIDMASGTDTASNGTDNPKVGNVSTFRTFAHGVTGTLTILDNRTLQITGFNYDGNGPSVFFYTGNDGNFSSRDGGQIIGPRLNGRIYTDETITLTLPDNLTLDDFNGLSVWCDIFFVDFGSADVI